MKTRRFEKKDVKEVAELLKSGKVVAFPTDTVFGLGVIYENEEALRALKAVSYTHLDVYKRQIIPREKAPVAEISL